MDTTLTLLKKSGLTAAPSRDILHQRHRLLVRFAPSLEPFNDRCATENMKIFLKRHKNSQKVAPDGSLNIHLQPQTGG